MASKAVLALGVARGQWSCAAQNMTAYAILLHLEAVMRQIGWDGRVAVARAREQRDENNHGNGKSDEDKIGRLWLKPHQIEESGP